MMKKKINKVLHPHIYQFLPLPTEEEEVDQDQYEMESTSEKVNVEGARFVDEESHNTLSNSKTNETGTDAEKASSYAQSTTGLDHKSETAKAERRLLFKLGE